MAEPMDRNDKHGARTDDAMARELRDEIRAGHSTRAEEWREPEPEADPGGEERSTASDRGGPTPGMTEPGLTPSVEALRTDIARFTERRAFPADRAALERVLGEHHAPDRVVEAVHRLPAGLWFDSPAEAARAVATSA